VGNNNFYIGGKFQDLSNEATLLRDAGLWKGEIGTRDLLGFLTTSLFAAKTTMPNMASIWANYFMNSSDSFTPLDLTSYGGELKLNPKFDINGFGINPSAFISRIYSTSSAKNTQGISARVNDPNDKLALKVDDSSYAWAFQPTNLGVGLGFSFRRFNVGYNVEDQIDTGLVNQGGYDGTTNLKQEINAGYKGKNLTLEYLLTINNYTNYMGPTVNVFDSNINAMIKLPANLYLKAMVDINHKFLDESNVIGAVGYSDPKSQTNLEVFYNWQDKTVGISFSTKSLESLFDRDVYSNPEKNFINQSPAEATSIGWEPNFPGDVQSLHAEWGNTLQDAIAKIKADSRGDYHTAINEIAKLESHILYQNHEGTFTASEEYNTGYGVCRDTNGQLLPALINGSLGNKGYSAWGRNLDGSYLMHDVTVIQKPNGKYDLMQYNIYYETNADTEVKAIDSVFPGAYIIGGGQYSPAAQAVIDALQESVWK